MSDRATPKTSAELLLGVLGSDRRAVVAALNLIEDRRPAERERAADLLSRLPAAKLERAGHLVGLTGPPGVGKSTLAAALIRTWRARGRSVAVLAVDPSSPTSGGALLGDRLRMQQPQPDPGVLIRSLAGRGELGGLSAEVYPMSQLLLCAFDVVLVETIGVGQSEIDVVSATDTTCLVAQPGSGDTIQYLKAGIVELPAIFAVNKADIDERDATRPAQRAAGDLRACLPATTGSATGSGAAARWQAPVLLVSAQQGDNVDVLADAIEMHRAWLGERDGERLARQRRSQATAWAHKRVLVEFGRHGIERLGGPAAMRAALDELDSPGKSTRFAAFEALRQRLLTLLGSEPVDVRRNSARRERGDETLRSFKKGETQ